MGEQPKADSEVDSGIPIAVSVVVPTYNEDGSIAELVQQIDSTTRAASINVQVVFVDDGSTDQTWSTITRLANEYPFVQGIRLRRNFGKAAALNAGILAVRHDVVITMDADLQDDPAEIPNLLAKLEEGFEVVSGWKKVRHDPWHKRFPSLVFNSLVSRMTGLKLHDHNCGLKAYRRAVFDDVNLYGERHRFIPVLANAKGWRVGELVVSHRPRVHGQSKYGLSRLFKGFLDLLSIYLLTGFSHRPSHLIGGIGMLCFGLGGIGIGYLSVIWVLSRLVTAMDPVHLHERAIFYYCILAVLLGAQFMLAGLLAELIVSRTSKDTDHYSITERTDDR